MEPKTYQRDILRDVAAYLDCLDERPNLRDAWQLYWADKPVNAPTYKDKLAGVPNVCVKVPTGGGKTFLACAALKKIFRGLGRKQNKFVVWLVPSDAILSQTVAALSNESHPYRQRINTDFQGRVEVFTKDMLLTAQNFSPSTVAENLCVCVLSYATLRIKSKNRDVRKVYQENGALKIFDTSGELLTDTPDTALIQVVRKFNPVVVVDESHNAESTLSVEMLEVVNPSFVLELTATPRESSNIISFADARALQDEHMIKLPMYAKNCSSVNEVISDAIKTRNFLEAQAKRGEYVRPIALFQAQPKTDDESETFTRVKARLVALGIPAAQIAIKTSTVNELVGVDLMSESCPIRYIVTVNALKEGWDCPFAYVLASLANKTSRVDVEQIVGRILRQPYARPHAADKLNMSYVYTCSKDFFATLENLVTGLNAAGFSRQADRVADAKEVPDVRGQLTLQFGDGAKVSVSGAIISAGTNGGLDVTFQPTINEPSSLQPTINEPSSIVVGTFGGEERIPMQEQFAASARELKIPQFFQTTTPSFFGASSELLECTHLSRDFKLSQQDARINFSLNLDDAYKIDLQREGEALPRYSRISLEERREFNRWLKTLPPASQLNQCASAIAEEINRNNAYVFADVLEYVRRILNGLSADELNCLVELRESFAAEIKRKIDKLENNYRRETFRRKLAGGQIFCEDFYSLPADVVPPRNAVSIPKSLYAVEGGLDSSPERRTLAAIAELDNVLWWHRNVSRREFRLNGWINHFPDFIVRTRAGHVVLVEFKGDDRDNSNSKNKLDLGNRWQSLAGERYRYFMVFDNNPLDDAFSLNEFLNVMQSL